MVRPQRCRRVSWQGGCRRFIPVEGSAAGRQPVTLTLDELEAIRLADLLGLYQEQAAQRMGVSRQTFGRIVESARRKVAQALTEGLPLQVLGGVVTMAQMRVFQCSDCGHSWEVPFGTGRPAECPQCHSRSFHRLGDETVGPEVGERVGPPAGRGPGRGRGGCRRRRGPGCRPARGVPSNR